MYKTQSQVVIKSEQNQFRNHCALAPYAQLLLLETLLIQESYNVQHP